MVEVTEDSIRFSFQWAVGDRVKLEKSLIEVVRSNYHHIILTFARFAAVGVTFLVARLMLPYVDLGAVIIIAFAGSFSLWIAWGLSIMAFRAIERLSATDPKRVGWNVVTIDQRGIIWSNDVSQEYTSWLGVSEVIENEGSLWIKTGPVQGYYLPPRIFDSDAQVKKCASLVESFRRNPSMPVHTQNISKTAQTH